MLGDRFSPRRAQPAPETKRKGAASAIVVTARKYFTFLTRLKELFLDPLQEQSRRDSSLLSAQQVKAIFSSLEAIYTVTKALTDDFNKIFSGEWSPSFVFGPLLCKLDIYIKSYYLSYFTNLNFALYTLGRARKDNPRLATFLKNAEEALRAKYGHKDLPVIRYADSDFYKPYDSSHLQPPPSSLSSSSPIDTPSTTVSSPLFSSSAPASVNCLPATLPLAVPLFTPLSAHRPTSPPASNQPVNPDYTYMYSDLPSALLAPIHFLPKYKTLIQTLVSATTPETQDAESIQEHLNVVSATLQDCLSDLFTQHATIIQQQSIFSFTPSFLPQEVISARKLLRAGFLTQLVMQKGVASSPPTIGFKGNNAQSDDSSLLEIGTGGSNSPSSSLLITSSPGSSQMSIRTWHSNKDGESWRGARIHVRVLLFTDVLVIADAQQNEYSLYPLAHVLQMNEVTVDSADGGADAGEYGIRVYSSVAELFLLDSDKTSREQWLSLFHNVNGKKHAVRRSFIISDVPTEASTDMLIKQLSEQKLKRLHLAPKSIRPAQAMTLAQAITASTSLTYVSLSQNNLDDTVVSVLSSWLAEYNGLRVLRLDHNEVTAGGAIAIADALRYNTSLEDLSLNYNRIGDHGVTAISTSVLAHPSITTLNVTHNDIKCFSQFSRSAIRNLLCFNKTLSELLIAENFNASDSSEVVGYLAGAIVGARVSALGKIEWDVGSTTEAQQVVSEKLQANVSRIRKASRVGPESSTSPRLSVINSNNPASQTYIDTLDMGYAGYVDISTSEINNILKGVSLGSITSLCLDHNTLFQIGQPVLQSLVHLRSLLLSHNRFETVPPSIKLLTNLTMLDFSHNRLTRFPKEVIYLINLQELDLSFNSIHSFGRETTKHLGRLSRLWRLALHRNFLTSVPTALFHLTRLTYLSVTSNPAIPLAKQKLYENFVDKNPLLDLSRCFLKSVPTEIEILTHLTTLDLSNNSLETLPPHVSKLTSLQTLSLAHNQLASLPWQLSKITKLTRLSLAGNPRLLAAAQAHATALNPSLPIGLSLHALQSAQTLIRPEFVEREIDAQKMMSNFKEPVTQYPCSRMKLMLVGQENVGKTSLAQALRKSSQRTSKFPTILTSSAKSKLRRVTTVGNILGDPAAPTWGHYSPTASHFSSPVASPNQFNTIGTISSTSAAPLSTDGIDMEEWTPPSTEDPISFQVWDFGGQEVYYLTHQFFLKNGRCVFLLVFSLELGYDANRIEYWLRVVEERARDSSVILVGTHLDSITEEKAATILADLQSKYQRNTNVKCAVAVSCKTNRYMEKLKDLIISLSSSDVKMKETFPLSFFQLESVLLAEKENRVPPLMTMVEFRNTARACGVLHNDIPRAMDFLVQLGNIVYFNDSNVKLEDVVILDPRWLTKFMATLITTKPTFVQNGVLSRHHLEQVWRPPEYPSDIHHSLLSLLHKFEICFPFPARDKGYLVPSLLPANRPVLAHFVADPLTRLERLYRFHTPLYGFFSRLMVRLLHFMDGIQYWRDGILLGQHDTFALLEFKNQSQQMQVRVWGQHACRWLRNIMESIDILLTGWYYTKVSIVIPCVCSVCAPIDSNTLPTNFRSPKPTRDRRVLKKSESAGTPENATKNRILSTIGKINKSTPPASPSTREISQSAEILVPPNVKPAASNALTLSSSAPSLSTRPPRPPRALPRAAGTPMPNPLLDTSGGADPLIPSPRSTNPSLGSSVPSPRDPIVSPRSATPSSPPEAYRPGPLSSPGSYKPGPASPPGYKLGPASSPNGFKQGSSSPSEAYRPSIGSRPISPPATKPFAASSRPSSPPSPLRSSTAPSSPASPTSPISTSPSSTPITIPSSASSPSIPSSVSSSSIPAMLATSPSSPPTFSTSPTSASLSTSPTSASLSTSPSAVLTPPPHLVTPPPSPIPRNMITITKARSSSVFEDKPPVIPTLSSSLSAPNNLDQQVSTSRDRSYSIGHQTIYGGQRAYITYDKCEEAIAKFEQTILCPRGGGVVQLNIITPELLLRDVQEETDIDIVEYDSLAIGKVVAQGGFGTVCETVYNDEVVAIKTRTFLDSDAVSEMREFRREAWLSSSISHRTIVALRGITLSPPGLIMEYIPHGTLHNFLHSRQVEEVSQKMRLTILHNIADALRHLHSRTPKICHRDLKPRNCLMVALSLDAEEIANEEMKGGAHVVCKLADFGESRSVVVSATGRDNLGNPLWLAPEVIRAEVYTEKADVFSFGIVAYEVLTHQDPYSEYPIARGNFMAKLEDKIITGLRPTLPPSTPDDLRRLIETCWDTDPNLRPSFLDIYAKIKQMVKAQL